MKLPDALTELLARDGGLNGAVSLSISRFEPWLASNALTFFPEYTDHGPVHIERVLQGAARLLPDEAWTSLGPEDATVLVLATVLHDCGMHLSKDGFRYLVSQPSRWQPRGARFLDSFRDPPWPVLWDEFCREASRFDEQKLTALFGGPYPVRRPPGDDLLWTDRDKLLIGEFVRRHHARLAHEIAVAGVPGPGEERLTFIGLEDWMLDLVGLVARSHNMNLRAAVEKLPSGGIRAFRRVHAPLLMSLLRVADYLEIDALRAPSELLKVRRLRSPLSQHEWQKHHAVKDVKFADERDHEAVWIDAEPSDINTFLSTRTLITGLQAQLDASAAVLAEVYGSRTEFGMRLRRVRSTLDDVEAFSRTVSYVPIHAAFASAGTDLLKRLVGPLYGDEAAYGIRELLQNAVDACEEFADYRRQHPDVAVEVADLEGADVTISLVQDSDGCGLLAVDDRGIGMTTDVVINYFLKAGASFRSSELWARQHLDPDGRPRVVRAGRFGVGVLATFLIGDQIDVTTRHASQPRGLRFSARIEDPHIELQWHDRPVGTSIRVRIGNPRLFDTLHYTEFWDWYRRARPVVERRVTTGRSWPRRGPDSPEVHPGVETLLPQGETIPHHETPAPVPWRRLPHADFDDILWSFENGRDDVHNGIVLTPPGSSRSGFDTIFPTASVGRPPLLGRGREMLWIYRPRIAVLDRAALLPIDLRRTAIAGEVPFRDELCVSVCRDVLASLLVRMGTDRATVFGQLARPFWLPSYRSSLSHPGVSTRPDQHRTRAPGDSGNGSWLLVNPRGLTLDDPAICARDDARTVVAGIAFDGRSGGRRYAAGEPETLGGVFDQIPASYCIGTHNVVHFDTLQDYVSRGYRSAALLLHADDWTAMASRWQEQGLVQQVGVSADRMLVWLGDDPRPDVDIDNVRVHDTQNGAVPILLRLHGSSAQSAAPRSPLGELWQSVFKTADIPFDPGERRRVLAHAYEELKGEIAWWERYVETLPVEEETMPV
jgi:molecular chaperone HtpG